MAFVSALEKIGFGRYGIDGGKGLRYPVFHKRSQPSIAYLVAEQKANPNYAFASAGIRNHVMQVL